MAAPKTLGQALLLAQDAMPKLALDATNPHFHSKFVSLPALLDAVRPILNANGLILAQHPTHLEDGTPALRTQIIHAETFEYVESTMPLMLAKQDPQGLGSAITYGRRYSLMSVLGLAGDEDDDGNAASKGGAKDGAVSGPNEARSAPAPASTFQPPDVVRKAQEAQEARANREAPADGGDPGQVEIHFGKNQGRRLSDLTAKQVEWYATTWEPNPQYANDVDRRLKMAAQLLHGIGPENGDAPEFQGVTAADDSIPF